MPGEKEITGTREHDPRSPERPIRTTLIVDQWKPTTLARLLGNTSHRDFNMVFT